MRFSITTKNLNLLGIIQPLWTKNIIYQAKIDADDPPKTYLLRIFVDVDRNPPRVVTVYKTSKLEKYWR